MPIITFRPADHTYWHGTQQLTSATQLVKEITPPFDRDRIAARCAVKSGKSVDEILAKWEAKGEAGRTRGSLVHQYAEDVMDNIYDPVLAAMNERLPEMDAFDDAWAAFRERLDARVVAKETIVGDPQLGVAGRVDVILDVTPKGERTRRCICDHKTGSFETTGKWGNLLPPFAGVGNCELARYSIQLSIYRLILERTTADMFGDSYLIHLGADGRFRIHRATDYRTECLAWLTSRSRT